MGGEAVDRSEALGHARGAVELREAERLRRVVAKLAQVAEARVAQRTPAHLVRATARARVRARGRARARARARARVGVWVSGPTVAGAVLNASAAGGASASYLLG